MSDNDKRELNDKPEPPSKKTKTAPKKPSQTSTSPSSSFVGLMQTLKKSSDEEHANEKTEIEQNKRRLDSLARILMLDGECAAVYHDVEENILVVTQNHIFSNSDTSKIKSLDIYQLLLNPGKNKIPNILIDICSKPLTLTFNKGKKIREIIQYQEFM